MELCAKPRCSASCVHTGGQHHINILEAFATLSLFPCRAHLLATAVCCIVATTGCATLSVYVCTACAVVATA